MLRGTWWANQGTHRHSVLWMRWACMRGTRSQSENTLQWCNTITRSSKGVWNANAIWAQSEQSDSVWAQTFKSFLQQIHSLVCLKGRKQTPFYKFTISAFFSCQWTCIRHKMLELKVKQNLSTLNGWYNIFQHFVQTGDSTSEFQSCLSSKMTQSIYTACDLPAFSMHGNTCNTCWSIKSSQSFIKTAHTLSLKPSKTHILQPSVSKPGTENASFGWHCVPGSNFA